MMTNTEQEYPILVVESMPNWVHHFKVLKEKLGFSPNAGPCGLGVRFVPENCKEFRTIHRYLKKLAAKEEIKWYVLSKEETLKIALRGLPINTAPESVIEALRELGYDPKYARQMHTENGRPGIFQVILRRSPDVIPEIWNVTELLNMPGIKITQWQSNRRNKPRNGRECHETTFERSVEPELKNTESCHGNANPAPCSKLQANSCYNPKPESTEAQKIKEPTTVTTVKDDMEANSSSTKRGHAKKFASAPLAERTPIVSENTAPIAAEVSSVEPSATAPTSTQTLPTNHVKQGERDPLEKAALQFALDGIVNIIDAIRGSEITNKINVLEAAFLAAYKMVTYKVNNPNTSDAAENVKKSESTRPKTSQSSFIGKQKRHPIEDAVFTHARENLRSIMEAAGRDSDDSLTDSLLLAEARLLHYRAHETPEICEAKAVENVQMLKMFMHYSNYYTK